MFSVKVAKPVPLNAPSVDAILVTLEAELEFNLPEEVLPEGVLPGIFAKRTIGRRGRGTSEESAHQLNARSILWLRGCELTCSCAVRSRVPRQQRPRL